MYARLAFLALLQLATCTPRSGSLNMTTGQSNRTDAQSAKDEDVEMIKQIRDLFLHHDHDHDHDHEDNYEEDFDYDEKIESVRLDLQNQIDQLKSKLLQFEIQEHNPELFTRGLGGGEKAIST